MVEVVAGKRGNPIVFDRNVKRMLGVRKHVILVNLGNEYVEKLKELDTYTLAVNIDVIRESDRVVLARLRDFPVKRETETRRAEDEYVVYEVTTTYDVTFMGRRIPAKRVARLLEVKDEAYTRNVMEELATELRRLPGFTARRLRYFAMGHTLKLVPLRCGLKPEAAKRIEELGENPRWHECKKAYVEYVGWWFTEDSDLVRKLREKVAPLLFDVLGLGARYEYRSPVVGTKIVVGAGGVTVELRKYYNDCPFIECEGVEITISHPLGKLTAIFNDYGLMYASVEGEELRRKLLEDDEFTIELARFIEDITKADIPCDECEWEADEYMATRNFIDKLIRREMDRAFWRRPGEYTLLGIKLDAVRCEEELWCEEKPTGVMRREECEVVTVCYADERKAAELYKEYAERLGLFRALFPEK